MTQWFADARDYDVFLVLGQSNARGAATNYQTYSGSTGRMSREDGLWALLSDPTDSDETTLGSPYPLLASILEAATGNKFAFITAGQGSTGLVNPADWPQGGAPYNAAIAAYQNANPRDLKGILWYQGETDITNSVAQADYQTALSLMLDNFQSDLGVSAPLVCACVAYMNGEAAADLDAIRLAQIDRWVNDADIYAGPTGIDQTFPGDGTHWKTDAEMLILAQRWARCLLNHFYGGSESARGPQFSSAAAGVDTVTITFTGGQGDLQNQTDTTGWECTDGNGARTVQSATGTSNTVTITLDQVLVPAITVSFGSGNTASGTTLKDSGTYPLPPEPFVDEPVV